MSILTTYLPFNANKNCSNDVNCTCFGNTSTLFSSRKSKQILNKVASLSLLLSCISALEVDLSSFFCEGFSIITTFERHLLSLSEITPAFSSCLNAFNAKSNLCCGNRLTFCEMIFPGIVSRSASYLSVTSRSNFVCKNRSLKVSNRSSNLTLHSLGQSE